MKHLLEYKSFNELSDDAKKNAIENVRNEKWNNGSYGGYYVIEDVLSDDAIFEPPQKEMDSLFGSDYYHGNGDRFMIQTDGKLIDKISFDSKVDQNYFLHCGKGIEITNDNLFLRWLGIPSRYFSFTYYSFKDSGTYTKVEFEIEDEESLMEKWGNEGVLELENSFTNAEKKWESHMSHVLDRITSTIESFFEDDTIISDIESLDVQFDDEGNIE